MILTTERIPTKRLSVLQRLADDIKTFGKTELDFRSAFIWLRKKWSIKRLLCEGGGELDGHFFRPILWMKFTDPLSKNYWRPRCAHDR